MSERIPVAPIPRGYRFSFALNFTAPGGGAPPDFDLTTAARVIGQFRDSPSAGGDPRASVDTVGGSLQIVSAASLAFTLTPAQTAGMPNPVWVDFARLDGGVWSLIPLRIAWPVDDPVTVPPA